MDKVTLALHREGCQRTGGYTLIIGQENEEGYGHGYRVFGPKICSLGNDIHLTTVELDERDAREIFGYIAPLLGDEWLAEQVAKSSSVDAGTPQASTDGPATAPEGAAVPSGAGSPGSHPRADSAPSGERDR